MQPGVIRPLALCIVWRGEAVLVYEGHDPTTGLTFYRPLGGGILFGEQSAAAAVRELREELGAELLAPRFIGVLENVFVYDGEPGHEIVLLYEGTLGDPALYAQEALAAQEDDGTRYRVRWMPLAAFQGDGAPPLFPDGLLALLAARLERQPNERRR